MKRILIFAIVGLVMFGAGFGGAALAIYPLLSKYLTQEWIMAGFGIGGLLILLFSLARR